MSRVVVGKIIEFIVHPFAKGDLTATGLQWSANTMTELSNNTAEVTNTTIDLIGITGGPGGQGTIIEVECGLTGRFSSVTNAEVAVRYGWQARNQDGNWVDLHATVNTANIGLTWVESTYSGRFATVANFNSIPFDVRLQVEADRVNEGWGAIKNSSYLRYIYKIA